MDSADMKELLQRYFNGETTPAEEQQVRAYFREHPGSDDDARFFEELNKVDQAGLPKDFLQEMSERIDEAVRLENRKRFIRISRWASGIAAAILLAILIPFMNRYSETNQQVADTYTSPEDAYRETQRVLLFISSRMNNQAEKLERLSSIDRSIKKAGTLEKIDETLNVVNDEESH